MAKQTQTPGATTEKTPEQIKAELKAQREAAEKAMTKEEYSKNVKDSEKHLIHVKLDKPHFHKETGEKLSVACVQIFHKTEFEQFKEAAPRLGYKTVEVLWGTEDYKAYLAEKAELAAKADAEAAANANK
jgi:hypothetical protein